jgi:hypothetical protein
MFVSSDMVLRNRVGSLAYFFFFFFDIFLYQMHATEVSICGAKFIIQRQTKNVACFPSKSLGSVVKNGVGRESSDTGNNQFF